MVFCKKFQKELEGLERAPLPGKKGLEILQSVSKQAWLEWQSLQTMIINEKHLNLMEPAARNYLMEQMDKFFNNEETDHLQGYVNPDDIQEL
ncbi:oxidative damage protection protein [Marinomonas mediterranea]|jgi:Fe-S cluster protector protein|uniref:Probable Fe(2+)-trafficking protein n=1 Tax=Marinomonas mediterranea (strain ATCC 700492 / JCM 21426 / NBRC 103028 / MMB-1) TaxID=717774 RepID=F2K151_MARM1|nr:oxidative damage protection protein [Marinomonas mediterranea]ADZ89901.1 Fe(2+)-trafficking protein [Marinomonas mediterranea MMB-1]WCN12080.1 oxidative damage protection protein [Marinomonas mediterranea]WCN16118.1 oxidative damage protection protein [Marinomonas mediterranea MMB-1]